MVIMERGKLPELAANTSVQEQNTTDEEKSAAATGLESAQWSRCYRRAQAVMRVGGPQAKPTIRVRGAVLSLG